MKKWEEVGLAELEPLKHQKGHKQDGLVLVTLWLIGYFMVDIELGLVE